MGASASVSIDTGVPTLTSMNITGASGIVSNILNEGDVVQITATFSEAVTVNATGGNPKVVLNIGGASNAATYVSGSGTTDLLFNYTILAGQNDANGISYGANALGLNGGTLLDGTGNAAVITASARTDNSNYKVDTTAPTVTVGSDKASLLAGQTAAITFTFSEDPGASFDAADITLSNGNLSTLSGVGLTRSATFTPTANLTSGNGSVAVNVGSYQDAAGNVGAAGSSGLITLDTAAPTVLSLALNAASTGLLNSTFNAGDVAAVQDVEDAVGEDDRPRQRLHAQLHRGAGVGGIVNGVNGPRRRREMCRSKLIDLLLAVPPQHPFERAEHGGFVNVRQAALAGQQRGQPVIQRRQQRVVGERI